MQTQSGGGGEAPAASSPSHAGGGVQLSALRRHACRRAALVGLGTRCHTKRQHFPLFPYLTNHTVQWRSKCSGVTPKSFHQNGS